MRIYAVADIHSKPEKLKLIQDTVRRLTPDVLVAAGDIARYFGSDTVLAELNDLGIPVLIVRGNTDSSAMEKWSLAYNNISSLHLQSKDLAGIHFAGVGGTLLLPFRSRLGFWEAPYVTRLKNLIQARTVFVAHPPPFGTLDEVAGKWHSGSTAVGGLVDTLQPRLCICGHIHESSGIKERGKTLVVNCSIGKNGAGALIELDEQKIQSAIMI